MKICTIHILPNMLLLALTFLLLSCNKDNEEPVYATKFHFYSWDVDTVPLFLPSSALDRTFQIKDEDGYIGGITGVIGVYGIDHQDTVTIYNTGLDSNLINSIVLDTIRGNWFTIITEEKKRLRLILDKNEGTETRFLEMPVWVYPLENVHIDGHPYCEPLRIRQQPSKVE